MLLHCMRKGDWGKVLENCYYQHSSPPPPPCFGILVWKWVADGLHGVLVAVQQVSSCSTLWVYYSNKISHGYICHLFGLLNKQFFTTPWCWVSCCLIYRSLPLLSSRFLLKLLIPREWTNVCVLRDKDWQVGTHEVALFFILSLKFVLLVPPSKTRL